MALTLGAQGTYADVTGVVDTTAAAEIVTILANFDALFNPGAGAQSSSPDFDMLPQAMIEKLQTEVTALAAAIAAAPTV